MLLIWFQLLWKCFDLLYSYTPRGSRVFLINFQIFKLSNFQTSSEGIFKLCFRWAGAVYGKTPGWGSLATRLAIYFVHPRPMKELKKEKKGGKKQKNTSKVCVFSDIIMVLLTHFSWRGGGGGAWVSIRRGRDRPIPKYFTVGGWPVYHPPPPYFKVKCHIILTKYMKYQQNYNERNSRFEIRKCDNFPRSLCSLACT